MTQEDMIVMMAGRVGAQDTSTRNDDVEMGDELEEEPQPTFDLIEGAYPSALLPLYDAEGAHPR